MDPLQTLLSRSGVIMADGAMGTMLMDLGLEHGASPELWNVDQPDRIRSVHRGYLEAGAQLILSNTFGGNRFRLGLHNLQDRAAELNRVGVELARQAVDEAGGGALVAGDIGPSGELLEPFGNLTFAEAVAGFAEQAQALIRGGADVIWIETISALDELRAAIEGVKGISPQIPVIATMTFDTHGRTMMGVAPEEAIKALEDLDVAAAGGKDIPHLAILDALGDDLEPELGHAGRMGCAEVPGAEDGDPQGHDDRGYRPLTRRRRGGVPAVAFVRERLRRLPPSRRAPDAA